MASPSGDKDDYLDFLPKDQADKLKEMYGPEFFQHPKMLRLLREFNLAERLLKREMEDDVAVSPLMQILSITLYKDQDDGTMSEIYGTILIDDGEGPSFPIYNRAVDEPQRAYNAGRLILSIPKDHRAIIPSNKVDIAITLLSRVHKVSDDEDDEMESIVEAHYRWDFTKFSEYDIPRQSKIVGAHGFVIVNYVVYRHAVAVTVDATLLKKEDDNRVNSAAHVYGTISARCGNNCGTYLFEKEESETVMVEYGSGIELSSAVVVIPVWQQFVIEAQLWSRNPPKVIVNGETENFHAIDIGSYSRTIEGEDNIIKAEVTWRPAYIQVPTGNNTHDLFPVVKKMRITSDQQPLLVETINRNLHSDLRKSLERTDCPLLEVFSVSVHNRDKKEFSVWGSIKSDDIDSSDQFLFRKEKTSAVRLMHDQTIPLTFPVGCMKGAAFSFVLDLKDEDDCVVTYGSVCWSPLDFRTLFPLSSYGRKLCSVIQGDNGYYTALHCSIFNGGLKALVKVHLIDKSSTMKYAKVYGSVESRYSTFKYMTIDDKELYTRKLYARRIEDIPLTFAQSKILLSESYVSVPITCALLIDVDLKVNSRGADFPTADSRNDIVRGGIAEHVEGRAVFSTEGKIENWVSDETLAHQIQVSVEWIKC